MSSAISESSVYEASVIGPDDGDPRNAASVRTGLQDLANRTVYLNDNKAPLVSPSLTTPTLTGATLAGTTTYTGSLVANGGIIHALSLALSDADGTLFAAAEDLSAREFRVPTLSGNRVYTFSGVNQPAVPKYVRVVRPRTADAFTVTIRDAALATVGAISASAAGWIEFLVFGPTVKVAGYGGTVTSLATTV